MSDEIKALVEMEKKLITAIISMYHTTRLSDTPFADHIHSKAIVRAAFASYREAALTAQADEIERLREVLEPFVIASDVKLCGEFGDGDRFGQTDVNFYLTFGDLRRARAALKAAQEVKL
jgi:DNA-binding FadR family transcriptional regulator